MRQTLREFRETWRLLRRLRMAFMFLLAYWCYIDGVDTIVRMAVDYGLSLGFAAESLLTALLITQLVGFPAALAFGHIGDRMGAKRAIWLALVVYVISRVLGLEDERDLGVLRDRRGYRAGAGRYTGDEPGPVCTDDSATTCGPPVRSVQHDGQVRRGRRAIVGRMGCGPD